MCVTKREAAMIRYLDNREKGLTKELWREAFPEDSEDFLDYYEQIRFSRCFI